MIIVGLFTGGVANLAAPDGRPLTTAIRKSAILNGILEAGGFRRDASAEPDQHTADKSVHLFADENYLLVEARLGVALPRPTFGENLTATSVREEHVDVDDHFQVGEAVVCVTNPPSDAGPSGEVWACPECWNCCTSWRSVASMPVLSNQDG